MGAMEDVMGAMEDVMRAMEDVMGAIEDVMGAHNILQTTTITKMLPPVIPGAGITGGQLFGLYLKGFRKISVCLARIQHPL